jgi:hypothetical protein
LMEWSAFCRSSVFHCLAFCSDILLFGSSMFLKEQFMRNASGNLISL